GNLYLYAFHLLLCVWLYTGIVMDINLNLNVKLDPKTLQPIVKALTEIKNNMATKAELDAKLDEVMTLINDKANAIKAILVELQAKIDAGVPVEDFQVEVDKLNQLVVPLADIDTTFPIGDGV
ncbi:MAG: hypothetical protein ACRDEA_15305, partial [Microcystaceae cyanobacterium]